MAHGFAGHFEKFGTPSSDIKYDSQYEELVSFDHRLLIEDVCSMQAPSSPDVTPAEIMKIVISFKKKTKQKKAKHRTVEDLLLNILSFLLILLSTTWQIY